MKRFYLDTSIWLDLYFKRNTRGKIAKRLVNKLINDNKLILYSDFTIKELKKVGLFESEINQLLSLAKPNNLKRIHSTKEQLIEASKILKKRDIPLGDIIHAIIARDCDAILVSIDEDFKKLKDIKNAVSPRDLI